jgi:hypothetical protein
LHFSQQDVANFLPGSLQLYAIHLALFVRNQSCASEHADRVRRAAGCGEAIYRPRILALQ